MQRKTILAAGLCALVLAASACGGGNDEPSASSSGLSATDQAATAVAAAAAVSSQGSAVATRPAGAATTGTTPAASTPIGTLAPLPTAAPGAANDFTATSRAHQALRSYRLTSEYVTGQGASPLRIVIEVQNPDRYHATFPTVTPGAGQATFEVIGIGSATYVKVGPTWVQGGAAASSVPFQAGQILAPVAGFLNSPNATRGATTTVAGASCTVWTVTSPTNQRADVCVGTDSLVRQIKYTDGTTSQTLTFDQFNANFNIVAP